MIKIGKYLDINNKNNTFILDLVKSLLTNRINSIIIFYFFIIFHFTYESKKRFGFKKLSGADETDMTENYSNDINKIENYTQNTEENLIEDNGTSEIIIILKGNYGINNIINCDFSPLPDEIFLNDTQILGQNCSVNLSYQNNNTIKMKWRKELSNSRKMFYSISNIISIDLSKFDTSFIRDMSQMFYNCSSFEFIKFKYFIINKYGIYVL